MDVLHQNVLHSLEQVILQRVLPRVGQRVAVKHAVFPEIIVEAVQHAAPVFAVDLLRKIGRALGAEDPVHQIKLVLKVVIIGSENSGKTNLTQKLANYYNTTYIKEYRKEYIEEVLQNNIENLQYEDYSQIAYRHNSEIINSVKSADRLLFIDTDFTSLQAFSVLHTGNEHPIIKDFIRNSNFDIIIYIENVDKNGKNNEKFDKELKKLLDSYNKKYVILEHYIEKNKYNLTRNYNKSIEIINNYIENNEMKIW